MRRIAFLLGTLAVAQMASAAVMDFSNVVNQEYNGATLAATDLTVTGSDGQIFAFRSLPSSGTTNRQTVIFSNRIGNYSNGDKLIMTDASGDLFALLSVDTIWRISGQAADAVVIGTKADNTTVTQTISASGTLTTFTFPQTGPSAFTGLREVRFDLGSSGNINRMLYDNINYIVPEPATLGVLGMSGAALLIRRRRKA